MACNGNCGDCAGCGRELVLTAPELALLEKLGQWAFLPVARTPADPTPVSPEEDSEEMRLVIQCLEKKGLISLDFDSPLKGFTGEGYAAYPIRGSMGLTQRGQIVLELMEYQGIQPEK